MKQGKSLVELASELVRIKETKKDYIVPTGKLSMNEEGKLHFKNGVDHDFSPTNWSGSQIASFTGIPAQYYKRISEESPELLAKNVNHGFQTIAKDEESSKRMLRTIDGKLRGFLSSRYRLLDSHDLLEAALPMLIDNQFQVASSEITEKRLYLKTTSEKVQAEVTKGDVVQYGVMLSTSDVGAGALRIEPFITRLVCLNGMVMESSFRKAHLGRNQFEGEITELLTDATRELNDQAFFATVRDYLNASIRPEVFQKEIDKLKLAASQAIKNYDLEEVVELSMKKTDVRGEHIKKSILEALSSGNEGAGLTRWGLANSFTAAAKSDSIDYETASDLERAGGMIIDLKPNDWKRIAEVPA